MNVVMLMHRKKKKKKETNKKKNSFNCTLVLHVRFCTAVRLCAGARRVLFIGSFPLMFEDCLWLCLL